MKKNRDRVFVVIGVLSFIAMTVGLVITYSNAGEAGVGLYELGPSLASGVLFLICVIMAKQNTRR